MENVIENTPTPTEWRLVALIYPESFFSGWGCDDGWRKELKMACRTEEGHPRLRFIVLNVGPEAGNPYSRMPYSDNVYFPGGRDQQGFMDFLEKTTAAIQQPPLFREDFSYLGTWEEDED